MYYYYRRWISLHKGFCNNKFPAFCNKGIRKIFLSIPARPLLNNLKTILYPLEDLIYISIAPVMAFIQRAFGIRSIFYFSCIFQLLNYYVAAENLCLHYCLEFPVR